jgi:NAD(P)-dependent dehydrogenase (short-subunit alcohol dehydrogenase family)
MQQNKIRFGLDGRVVVVTGGSQGIGEACARRLVADGARVALWDLADERGRALAEALRAEGADVRYQHCNVADKAEVDAALAATLADFGPSTAWSTTPASSRPAISWRSAKPTGTPSSTST